MGTLINPPVQLAPVSSCEASRDAVACGTGSKVVGLVGLLKAHSCIWASIRLAAVAHIWLLAEGLGGGGSSDVFNHLKMQMVQRTVRFRGA